MHGIMNGRPRCGECGHTMVENLNGWNCIENTCSIGLAVLGDFASAERVRKRNIEEEVRRLRLRSDRWQVRY